MPEDHLECAELRDELETLRFRHHCMELFYRGETSDGASMHERMTAMRDARINRFMAEREAYGSATNEDSASHNT